MKVVLTYGTFDIFHVGHVRLLRRLKALGDRLIVGLSTDEFNALKGKSALMRFEDRREVLEAVDAVDLVIPESSWDQKIDDVREHNVDIFGIGDDWEGKFDFLKPHCEVVYLSRTHGISSSSIKALTSGLSIENIQQMRDSVEVLRNVLKTFGD
ncbi:glycerol-3-phosphate cytidylyltransferase [Alloalcanivorax venustensis]|jgi:glycerol-3-phosphate cytidylyltransferase|uniref:Glycerol-3-phosphate cytidylyltransferase n=1 Tax=Alloalcanivorax venustensis ISO4 TaxID=1177184 RepID=A0ABS0AF34_9GAMM|nr:glycerol-3-phosphate cytidylyltransferase [Alloalcanivorax venustensis]MBF5052757.1 glycerol-3-phosphate cytidylyltransferase [Alloalcanivorax venustensis ISO4]|tara:strand:+ start:2012 stop:2473 length:462 start_codon:yes stop_codon:yes gene_type:complete